ncbi:MAG: GNAT family N-acetyltransferase [Desulfurococcaceae archaeon]
MEELRIKHTSQVIYAVLPDGSKAYVKYSVENNVMKLLETYVPQQYRGRGLAKQLVEYAIEMAKSSGLVIEPVCSYAIYYFMKNPEKRHILHEAFRMLNDEEWQKLYEEARKREAMKG